MLQMYTFLEEKNVYNEFVCMWGLSQTEQETVLVTDTTGILFEYTTALCCSKTDNTEDDSANFGTFIWLSTAY